MREVIGRKVHDDDATVLLALDLVDRREKDAISSLAPLLIEAQSREFHRPVR
jgi:hypothetical protein